MLEQWEAKAEQAGTLADKNEFVAAAALAEECVALADSCGASVSQRKKSVEFRENLEQMANIQQDIAECLPSVQLAMKLIQTTTGCIPCSQAQGMQVTLLCHC